MMTPVWILDIFAALMLMIAAVSAARLVVARPWQSGSVVTDTDVAHLLMAIAMAGMLASTLTTLPNAAWEVIFGLLTAWFAYRVVRDSRANGVRALAGGHCAPHLVHSAAMLYMFLALAVAGAGAGSGMSGMGASSGASASAMQTLRYPTLAFVFALILVGYTIWDLDQLSGRRYSTTPARVSLAGVPAMAGAQSPAAVFSATQAAGDSAVADATAGTAAGTAVGTTAGALAAEPAVPDACGPGGAAAGGFLLSPATTVGCRIAMGVTMAFMLLIMI